MPKILLLNYHVELPIESEVPKRYPNQLDRTCTRAMWYIESNDIVVSPVHLNDEFLEFVASTMGFEPGSVTILVQGEKLYDDVILDPNLVSLLEAHTTEGGLWTLMPCNVTEGVTELARLLNIDDGLEPAFAAERGTDLLNRKSHFRQLAAGYGLPLASGAIVRSPEKLFKAITDLLAATGTVIVKQDNAAGGAGNIAFTSGTPGPLPGVLETFTAPESAAAIAPIWEQLTKCQEPVLVVESYHQAEHAFYFEYYVGRGGRIDFLSHGGIKRLLVEEGGVPTWAWIGLEIPSSVPAFTLGEALTQSAIFASAVAAMGHRGYMNIDAISSETGGLIFNEINARWGGGLVLHTISSRLLGSRYADRHVVSSVRNVPSAPFLTTLEVLRNRGLQFNPESREGVVLVAHGPSEVDATECLVIASNRERVRYLEGQLIEAFGRSQP